MQERYPDQSEVEDATEFEIEHLMDTKGLSRAAAIHLLGLDHVPQVTRAESQRQHPAGKGRAYRNRPAVGEDSQDIFTGIIDAKQAITNTIGAASIREMYRTPDSELSTLERARRRADDEKRGLRR